MNLSKKNTIAILLLIILIGTFLRFYKLGRTGFVADEFLDINASYSYFKTQKWQSWDFNLGKVSVNNELEARDERAWVYKWQVAQLFKFLSPTEGTARTVSALWGILTIILIYFIAVDFTKKRMIGLVSAFLFAVSISGIEFDRKLRMYAMFLPVYLVFSWLLFRFLEGRYKGKIGFLKEISSKWDVNPLYIIPALLVGILSLATHQLTVNITFVLGFYLLFWTVLKWNSDKSYFNKYSVIFGLGILGAIGASIAVPKMVSSSVAGLTFFTDHWEYLRIEFSDYSNGIMAFIFTVLGIYFISKKQNMPKEGSFLGISFFVILFSAVLLWSNNVGDRYIFFIKSFGVILIASGIYFGAEFLRDNLRNNGKKAYAATIILALLLLPNYAYFFESNNTYNQTSESSNPNYRKIFTYFKKYKKDTEALITRNFRNYYWSGAKVRVFDMGGNLGKDKMDVDEITKIQNENPSGWFIISSNDETYITSEAIDYIERNFERVSNPNVRGDVLVYRWGNEN